MKINFENIYFSKWFYYVIIGVVIALIYYAVTLGVSANDDFALRFNPTFIGLIINFAIFIVFFDFREYLELKQSQKPVKARIGKQLYLIFDEVTSILKVDIAQQSVGESLENWIERNDKLKLEKLVSNGVIIQEDTWEKGNIKMFARMLENLVGNLGSIEDRYSKPLSSNSYLRDSIITLEESLKSLKTHLGWGLDHKEMRIEATRDIEKIVEVIHDLRKNGIDVGF